MFQSTRNFTLALKTMMKNSIEIKELLPTLERAIARFGGIPSLSDFRVILRISEVVMWMHPDATDKQLESINNHINQLKNQKNHE